MILILLYFLHETFSWKIHSVYTYTSTRMILSVLTTLAFCIFLGPFFIKKLYELKIGQTIRTNECPLLGELHKNKQDTPTMGGILILASMLTSLFLWMDLTHIFTLILFVTTLVLGFMGGLDDFLKLKHKSTRGLTWKKKLTIQMIFSALLAAYLLLPSTNTSKPERKWFQTPIVKEQKSLTPNHDIPSHDNNLSMRDYAARIYIPFVKEPWILGTGLGVLFVAIFTILVITGSSNAVNLTDGLDGLATGCLLMVATCMAIIAFLSNNLEFSRYLNILYIEGSGEIAVYLCGFIGACLGFLWYNGHPAQVFMGDTGSLALGGIIGVSAVLLKREVLLAVIGGIFVAEAMSVILQVASYRFRNKKRVFLCAPLHHHYEYKGWPETKVVIRFWIISLLLSLIGLASIKFQ